ncbi:MAG: ATP synthase F0 subunit B, partial [Anaerolineae bacterium]|nr:ATP synthase F0 subunit B [Anaerolineae bacterium]
MEALGINAGFLIAQIVNFGVVILVLGLFLWRPLTRILDERAETVARQMEDAEVARKAREEAEATAAKIIDDARREAAKFAEEARSRGDEAREGLVVEARAEADRIVAEAREGAEEARNQQLAELR